MRETNRYLSRRSRESRVATHVVLERPQESVRNLWLLKLEEVTGPGDWLLANEHRDVAQVRWIAKRPFRPDRHQRLLIRLSDESVEAAGKLVPGVEHAGGDLRRATQHRRSHVLANRFRRAFDEQRLDPIRHRRHAAGLAHARHGAREPHDRGFIERRISQYDAADQVRPALVDEQGDQSTQAVPGKDRRGDAKRLHESDHVVSSLGRVVRPDRL